MANLNQELADFIVNTKYQDLSAKAVHDTKFLLLDSIGCALAGLSVEPGKMAVALARKLGGVPEASIIGTKDKYSCSTAAFANGDLIRAPDYSAMPPGGHSPEQVVPPALAIAESIDASGKDLLLATALGFEVAARLAKGSAGKNLFGGSEVAKFRVAEHIGLSAGNFGAVTGPAKLLGLNNLKTANALGIAGHLTQTQTNTKFTFGAHRPMTKYGVPGWQNLGGVMAAWLADMGYMGDTTVLDAENGPWKFLNFEDWNSARVTEGIGKTWEFTRVNYKPYPCCRMLHSQVDCMFELINKHQLKPEEITSVKAWGHPVYGYPLFTNHELNSVVDIQFGLHYILGMVANKVEVGIEWQDLETARSPKIASFAKKVACQAHPRFMETRSKDPTCHIGKVEVVANGKTYIEEHLHSKGTPGTPMELTDDEIIFKFRHNASRKLTQGKIDKAIKMCLSLEATPEVSQLVSAITL
jgi:2-methylcitrate dehydratase PrpD